MTEAASATLGKLTGTQPRKPWISQEMIEIYIRGEWPEDYLSIFARVIEKIKVARFFMDHSVYCIVVSTVGWT